MREDIYKIAVGLLQGIGIIKTKTLIAYAGGAKAVFSASDSELSRLSGASLNKVKQFNRKTALIRAEEELKFIEKCGVKIHYYQDNNYPTSLKFCDDGPIVLYSKGNIKFDQQNIAIVGTRKATAYGKSLTKKFIKDVSSQRAQIISGLAHGIDTQAHESALANNLSTIAVLGHGLDFIYPAANRKLAEKMLETGGLVTEYMSKTPGDPSNFPQRNRIVAGLSEATVVIESAAKGGSLITANLAFDYDRQVFAFPGNIDKDSSAGCNHLIRQNKAQLITSADDMLDVMGWEIDDSSEVVQSDLFEGMSVDEERVMSILKTEGKAAHIDLLSKVTKMILSELSLHLFNLEMRGAIRSLPGKMYLVS